MESRPDARPALGLRLRSLWTRVIDGPSKPLRKDIRQLQRQVERMQLVLDETAVRAARGDQIASQLRHIALLDGQQRGRLAEALALLDEARIGAHVRATVEGATLVEEPFEHLVLDPVLPPAVYDLLIEALPPLPFFGERDPVKQDLPLPLTLAPALSTHVWNFVHEVIAVQLLRPALLARFHEPLQRHYDLVFGPGARERAGSLPGGTSGGRLMLRRPGYHLDPHRDPKRSLLTCLLYLARPGDDERYGTQIFRVEGDAEAGYKQTYYPEQEGHRCELAGVVPFRANTMLVFLNSKGAHGADIPKDAPDDLERYTYQFYVTPRADALSALVKSLPKERRAQWRNKGQVRGG